MNEDIDNMNGVLNTIFKNISVSDMDNANTIFSAWKKVLLRVKSNTNPFEGQNLVDHTRVVDLKNGNLVIEADHPGWIELCQIHKKYILNGMKMECRGFEINNLFFNLAGKKSEIQGDKKTEKEISLDIEKRLEKEDENLKKLGYGPKITQNSSGNNELPPELNAIFDNLRKSVLTNSKN